MPTVYVDLDGTLIEYADSYRRIYADALASLGVDPRGLEAYSEAFFEGLGDTEDPFAAAIAETDVPVDPDAFADAMAEREVEAVRTVPGAADVLETLAADHRVGVLTNGVGRLQRRKLEVAGLADAVETVVVSGEVGASKPEPGMYRIAEDRLPADSYAFVADDLERDLRPAIERGWHGVYVGDDGPVDDDPKLAVACSLAAVPDRVADRPKQAATPGTATDLGRPVQRPCMRVEFDRETCIGMYQCVAEWDAFSEDKSAGKAVLEGSEEIDEAIFAREIPDDAELDAKFAARTCPVDAIAVYDDDGERLIP